MIVRQMQRLIRVDKAMYIKCWDESKKITTTTLLSHTQKHIHTHKTRSNLIKSSQIKQMLPLYGFTIFFIFCTKLAIYFKMHVHIEYTFASEIRDFLKRFQLRVDGRIKAASRVWITLENAHMFWPAIILSVFTSTKINIQALFSRGKL